VSYSLGSRRGTSDLCSHIWLGAGNPNASLPHVRKRAVPCHADLTETVLISTMIMFVHQYFLDGKNRLREVIHQTPDRLRGGSRASVSCLVDFFCDPLVLGDMHDGHRVNTWTTSHYSRA
jgi:hypothetical protein